MSPQVAEQTTSLVCRHCHREFKNEGGRIEHEKWCKQGPRHGHGDRPHDDDDDDDSDAEDTLMCPFCGEDVGGSNKGARATHHKACEKRMIAAEARGEPFVPSATAARERARRLSYTFAYKQRALLAVRATVDRDQRDVTTNEKELRARQAVAREFKVCAFA